MTRPVTRAIQRPIRRPITGSMGLDFVVNPYAQIEIILPNEDPGESEPNGEFTYFIINETGTTINVTRSGLLWIMAVGGGGGGGFNRFSGGSGGGAGGFYENAAIEVDAGTYLAVIGAPGSGGGLDADGTAGGITKIQQFLPGEGLFDVWIDPVPGGAGGRGLFDAAGTAGSASGSGASGGTTSRSGGAGTSPWGFAGGNNFASVTSSQRGAGGGGGFSGAGENASTGKGGNGGIGTHTNIVDGGWDLCGGGGGACASGGSSSGTASDGGGSGGTAGLGGGSRNATMYGSGGGGANVAATGTAGNGMWGVIVLAFIADPTPKPK